MLVIILIDKMSTPFVIAIIWQWQWTKGAYPQAE